MMEISLRYAIAKAKRNIENNKYSKIENILDAIYQYRIREDEVTTMMKSINKWIKKQNGLFEYYDDFDIKCIMRNL